MADPLPDGDDAQQGQQDQEAAEHGQGQPGPGQGHAHQDDDQPVGPGGDAVLGLEALGLGPGPGVGGDEGGHDGEECSSHAHLGPDVGTLVAAISHPGQLVTAQVDYDPGQDGPVRNPVKGGVQEAPELRATAGQRGHGTIQGVEGHQDGQDDGPGQEPAGEPGRDGYQGGAYGSADGDTVGAHAQTNQAAGDGGDDALPGAP